MRCPYVQGRSALLTTTILLFIYSLTLHLLEYGSHSLKPFAAIASSFLAPALNNVNTTNDDDSKLFSLITNETRFCFVHVGKTAGSKVSCELGLKYAALKSPATKRLYQTIPR